MKWIKSTQRLHPTGVHLILAQGWAFADTLQDWAIFKTQRDARYGATRAKVLRLADTFTAAIYKDGWLMARRSANTCYEPFCMARSKAAALEIAVTQLGIKCLDN